MMLVYNVIKEFELKVIYLANISGSNSKDKYYC